MWLGVFIRLSFFVSHFSSCPANGHLFDNKYIYLFIYYKFCFMHFPEFQILKYAE